MRRTVPVLAALLVALAVPAPVQAGCRDGVRVTRSETRQGLHTAVVVCERGRARVVRRALLRFSPAGRQRGTAITAAVRTSAGDVAWLEHTGRVAARLRGGRLRVLGGDAEGSLAAEGNAVRWATADGVRAADLRPPAVSGGCPVRPGYRPVQETPETLVTGVPDGAPERSTIIRACLRGTGRDVLLGSVPDGDGIAGSMSVIAVQRPYAVIVEAVAERLTRCTGLRLRVVDLVAGFVRQGGTCDDADVLPRSGDPLVVTSARGAAWVRDGVLFRLGPWGSIRELDRGAITGLRAEGDDVAWTRDGMERRAAV